MQDINSREHFESKQQPTEGTTTKEQEQEHEHVGGSGQGEDGIVSANDQSESKTGENPMNRKPKLIQHQANKRKSMNQKHLTTRFLNQMRT